VEVYGKCNNINGHGHNYVGELIIVILHTVFLTKSVLNRIITLFNKLL
jgi:6-pyruvoyl-tetrahydropterin synthase